MSFKEWLEEQMKVIKANGLPDHLTTADQEAVLDGLKFAGEMYDQYLSEMNPRPLPVVESWVDNLVFGGGE